MTDESGQVERTLRASKVAELFGRKGGRKTPAGWANADCPHDREEGGRGSRLFNFGEVIDWLDKQGFAYVLNQEGETLKRAHRGTSHADRTQEIDKAECTGGSLENVEAALMMLEAKVRGVDVEELTPAMTAKFSATMTSMSKELRAVREDERKHRERMGELVELDVAQDVVIQAIAFVVTDLAGLAATLPRTILTELSKAAVVVSDQDIATRVITDAISKATDEVRRVRSDWVKAEYGKVLPMAGGVASEVAA